MNKTLLKLAFNNGLLEKKCFFFGPINITKFSKKLKQWDKNASSKLSDFSSVENVVKSNPCKTSFCNVASSKRSIHSKAVFSGLQNKTIHSKAVYAKDKDTPFVPEKKQNLMHRELIEWGCHIGHKPLRLANKSKREFYPVVSKYLLGKRQNLNYIDVQFSIKQTLLAMYTIAYILNKGGSFLIVNTNQIFDELMSTLKTDVVENDLTKFSIDKKANLGNGIAFTQYKWIGGALSNWDQISKTVWRVAKFSEEFEMFLKTHSINFPAREFSIPSTLVSEFSIPRYEELKKSFRGLVEKQNTSTYLCFQKKPDLILLVNSTENLSIVREANSLCIPVMALTDSNTNLSGISYPIPVNSESISFFFRFLDLINRVNRRC